MSFTITPAEGTPRYIHHITQGESLEEVSHLIYSELDKLIPIADSRCELGSVRGAIYGQYETKFVPWVGHGCCSNGKTLLGVVFDVRKPGQIEISSTELTPQQITDTIRRLNL